MSADTLMDVGRVVFGGFFLIAGIRNFLHFGERRTLNTNYGWPVPAQLLAIGFAMQLLGGLALVLGLWVVAGAIVLIVFLFAATPLYHNLFMFSGKERDPHLYLTLVNITLVSGLLMVIAGAMAPA
jgi:putative oxidoreductase